MEKALCGFVGSRNSRNQGAEPDSTESKWPQCIAHECFEKLLLFWNAFSSSVLGGKLFPATSPQQRIMMDEKWPPYRFLWDARNEVWGIASGNAVRWQHRGNSSFSSQLFSATSSCAPGLQHKAELIHSKEQPMSLLKCHKSYTGRARSKSRLHTKLGLMAAPKGRQVTERWEHLEETLWAPRKESFGGRKKNWHQCLGKVTTNPLWIPLLHCSSCKQRKSIFLLLTWCHSIPHLSESKNVQRCTIILKQSHDFAILLKYKNASLRWHFLRLQQGMFLQDMLPLEKGWVKVEIPTWDRIVLWGIKWRSLWTRALPSTNLDGFWAVIEWQWRFALYLGASS